ncbi:hypothetical protein [Verminephrobacter eiseniae]|uniref:hypothetical protein n=1 Tax=Verminephrobacter eiseniae TaxID=364317 RepID=UPI002237F624|nr:hypothetical protein [Verminephrobacter eiseniae]MCW5230951.1 hypothetical protein [Verminephrobacter eiseniae]MCW5292684.1 hypothetical protein [Verminephrobacter eiseniae]MCW8187366.1 hypothetical protein [Verminephrobacter eiseniae]MCW8225723.1 hypothetical protein [Verminephrobacter eiseniae]MCW8236598.1 hypothetical protein [Verminephrobacter eiseniae]
MRKPEIILATLTDGAAALFVNSDAILTTDASPKEVRPEIVAKYLAKALGIELRTVQRPQPDDPAWSWNDVYAAIAPPADEPPPAADVICARLLDSEEHAGDAAIPPVAEDAVQVILKLEAELEAERSMSRLVQLRDRTRSRDIVGSLLEYVMRFAALNWERPTGECWSAIQAARIFLQKTTEQVPDRGEESKPEPASSGGDERASVLAALRAQGLTIGECIQALAVPDDDPYVKAARRSILGGDDLEIDDRTATAPGERGAWVLGWFWISDEQAGVLSNSAMLEALLDYARGALAGAHGLDAETARLRRNQADWLEDLLSNLADEVDAIALARPTSAPGAILWVDRQGRDVLFAPSDALLALLDLARQAGLEERVAGQCERFCAQYGSTLDRMLTVVQIG